MLYRDRPDTNMLRSICHRARFSKSNFVLCESPTGPTGVVGAIYLPGMQYERCNVTCSLVQSPCRALTPPYFLSFREAGIQDAVNRIVSSSQDDPNFESSFVRGVLVCNDHPKSPRQSHANFQGRFNLDLEIDASPAASFLELPMR